MIITEKLKKEIEDDIIKCEQQTDPKGSESLYGILVAKYSVLDSNFIINLSTNGKAAAVGGFFDYRQELKAIAAKLRMWLLSNTTSGTNSSLGPKTLKLKVDSFIEVGEEILLKEKHNLKSGITIPSHVSEPLFGAWMDEINVFNERYLKKHPLYKSINSTYLHHERRFDACEDMLGHLRVLSLDYFWWNNSIAELSNLQSPPKTMNELLANDILRCEQYIASPIDLEKGIDLYIEITSKYDNVIEGLGNGLYQYYSEQHFYDSDISEDTLIHNLKILINKMISFRSLKYGVTSNNQKEVKCMSSKIFIVHGHDENAKEIMARALEKVGFEAIILHEQVSSGNTIIEKIEKFTDVPFAVVLYSECDEGRARINPSGNLRFRARQNVVFEHGYLIGKLGRDRVCALVKGNVETPGDISGIVYINMDAEGAWKYKLAKEMQSAGLSVDTNKF